MMWTMVRINMKAVAKMWRMKNIVKMNKVIKTKTMGDIE